MNIVYNQDCLLNIDTGHVVVDDPPYGLKQNLKLVQSRNRLAKTNISSEFEWDMKKPSEDYFNYLSKCTLYFLFGANHFKEIVGTTFKSIKREDIYQFLKDNPTNWIVWDKCNGRSFYSDTELIYCNQPIESICIIYMWNGMMQGKSIDQGDVMQGNKKLNEKRIHPTQKPVLLYKWLFEKYIPKTATIRSNYVGSGSDRIAADMLGIDFYGYEIDTQMFNLQEARYNNFKKLLP